MIIFDVDVDAVGDANPRTTILEMAIAAQRLGAQVRAVIQNVQITAGGGIDPDALWQRWQAIKAGKIAPEQAAGG